MRYEKRKVDEEDDDEDLIKVGDDVVLDLGAADLGGGGFADTPIQLDFAEFA
jgi:hypothetical protein